MRYQLARYRARMSAWVQYAMLVIRIFSYRMLTFYHSSINMWTRNSAHASAISRGQRSRHYNMARQALSITVIILSRTTEALLFSEQLMILLCNSYYSYMSKPPTSTTNDSAAGWIAWAWEAYVLTRVANHCFQENGWITVTEMTGANGCNVQSPAARSADREAITWVKMVNRAHTVATYRRRPCKLTMHSGAALVIFQNMRLQVPLLPGSEINEDTVVYTVFERRLDGKPHAKPMCRLPLVGGYTDWREISTLACRVEWQTSKGWKAMYLQRVYLTENLMPINRYPPRAYRDASAILAALKGQVYTNPSPWRMQITSWKTVSVWWDQIHQQLRVLEDWQREQLPEPALRSLGEVGNELRALGFRVASTKPSGGSWRDGCDTCYMVSPGFIPRVITLLIYVPRLNVKLPMVQTQRNRANITYARNPKMMHLLVIDACYRGDHARGPGQHTRTFSCYLASGRLVKLRWTERQTDSTLTRQCSSLDRMMSRSCRI